MITHEKIAQIRALALTARATIYNEDAMTALELAGVTACKVNQCIDVINELCDLISDLETKVNIEYDANNESVTI